MAVDLERIKSYAGSVKDRTLGINAYQRWQKEIETNCSDRKDASAYQNRKIVGVILGMVQFVLPGLTKGVAEMWSDNFPEEKNGNSLFLSFPRYVTTVATDFASWSVVAAASHNPGEFIALKLAANAATHVGLDLGGAAIKRLKTFRPSANILAV